MQLTVFSSFLFFVLFFFRVKGWVGEEIVPNCFVNLLGVNGLNLAGKKQTWAFAFTVQQAFTKQASFMYNTKSAQKISLESKVSS